MGDLGHSALPQNVAKQDYVSNNNFGSIKGNLIPIMRNEL